MSQVSVAKKMRMVDTYAQYLVLHNLDIMAIISSYLKWKDVPNYVRVCRVWNKSFISRNWSMPKHVYFHDILPLSHKYFCYANSVIIHPISEKIVNLIAQTVIKSVTILSAKNARFLLLLDMMKLDEIYINIGNPNGDINVFEKFISNYSNTLSKLNICIEEYNIIDTDISIGNLPNLKYLRTNSNMLYYYDDGDQWDIFIDLRFLSIHCPKLEILEIAYNYGNSSLNDVIEDIEALYASLSVQHISQLKISEGDKCCPGIQSILAVKLPILLKSTTLKYIELELGCEKLGAECMFVKSIDPRICKIKIVGLYDSYDVIEN